MAAFTSVAAGIGLAATAAGTAKSFSDANKQKRLQKEAEADAELAMTEARKRLGVNFFDALAINKEPYELQRDALLSQGALGVEAAQEGETRGAAAIVGRVNMAQNQAQENIRTNMSREMDNIQRVQLGEDSRLRDINANIDLAEVEGSQKLAAQAYEAKNVATQQGIQGAINLVQQGVSMVPLFSKNPQSQMNALSGMSFSEQEYKDFGLVPTSEVAAKYGMGNGTLGVGSPSNLDFEAFKNMTPSDYKKIMESLTPQQRAMLFKNPQYAKNYKSSLDPFAPF